ncbi:tetratricopeptide repeat protein, partial [Candidatus Uhrbacteria bacterium]|nr:tetratricopeptide repeat protein [Candidatus Uhrbacteria bacterium]
MQLTQKKIVWGIGSITVLVVLAIIVRVLTVPWPPFFIAKTLVPKNTSQEKITQLKVAYGKVHGRPFYNQSWTELGTAWYVLGDMTRAIAAYKEAVNLGGEDGWLPRLNLSRLYTQQGKNDEARDLLRDAHK